jgi:hypothetical protein
MPYHRSVAVALMVAIQLSAACTLTNDAFTPRLLAPTVAAPDAVAGAGIDVVPPSTLEAAMNERCTDGVKNGNEGDVDCGGQCACPAGSLCARPSDCLTAACRGDGRCARARCDDGLQNQDETAPDCGGSCEAIATPSKTGPPTHSAKPFASQSSPRHGQRQTSPHSARPEAIIRH